jgi:glycosyltransferase involved in cell wall biosynthesis
LRIVFVAWRDLANNGAGGSEVLVDRLAAGLTARGHDVALLCAGPVGERPYRVVANGTRHTQYVRAPFAFRRHLRGADLVVDVANGLPFFARCWNRGPVLCFVNHIHTEQWAQWFPAPIAAIGRAIESRAMPWAYRDRLFVAVSPSTTEELVAIGVDRDRIRVVYNGVDVPPATVPKSAEPSFVAVGRFVPHKRFDLLVQMWDRVRPITGGRLTIIGEGLGRAELLGRADDSLHLPGRVSDEERSRLYGEAWALVHPAAFEGWGIVINEAAAAGTPAIGFRVHGVRDAIVDGETGFLCDDEDAFVDRWTAVAADVDHCRQMGDQARARARTFSWDRTVEQFEAVAVEAVQRAAPPPAPAAPSRPRLRAIDADRRTSRVSIVVPAYEEAARLPGVLPTLLDATATMGAELLLVDDGSTDGTAELIASHLRGASHAELVQLDRHRGKGAAVRAGVARAGGDVICFMDADLATQLDDLDRLLDALDDANVAIGSRAVDGSSVADASWVRVGMGRSFNTLARAVTGVSWRDTQCGFKAFRAPAAKLLFDLSVEEGFAFDLEVLTLAERIGYSITEVPVHWRSVPGSHIGLRDPIAMAVSTIRIGARIRSGRTLPSLRAWCRTGDRQPQQVAAAVRRHLPASISVVPYREGALALLPFAAPSSSVQMAAELARRLPDVVVEPSVVVVSDLLFDQASGELRAALAGA